MINVKATEVMAFDESGDKTLFTLRKLDWKTATIEMKCQVTSENIDQLTAALRRAFAMLELDH